MQHLFTTAYQTATITEAIERSGLDISYNPREALAHAKRTEQEKAYFTLQAVYVDTTGQIWTLIKCNDGLKILAKFHPFIHCMCDTSFAAVFEGPDKSFVTAPARFKKSKEARTILAHADITVTTDY